jgi:hypothetical protein
MPIFFFGCVCASRRCQRHYHSTVRTRTPPPKPWCSSHCCVPVSFGRRLAVLGTEHFSFFFWLLCCCVPRLEDFIPAKLNSTPHIYQPLRINHTAWPATECECLHAHQAHSKTFVLPFSSVALSISPAGQIFSLCFFCFFFSLYAPTPRYLKCSPGNLCCVVLV